MQASSINRQFADFIHASNFDDLPAEVIEKCKSRILDCLGTAIAARELPVPAVAMRFIAGNAGKASIFGHGRRVPAIDAALVNATLVNGRSQDDFLCKSHPGALTVPVAFAVAEEEGRSGADLITSIVIGYEIVGRVYLGGPEMLPKFRASGVAGTIAAAATAGKLYRLDHAGLMNALGCGALLSSGFGEGFLSGTMEVKLNVGMSSRSGLSAALLARAGATASEREFEGPSGFYLAFAGTTEQAFEATRDLGKRFLIHDVVYKECPVCIFVQTPLLLARDLYLQKKLAAGRIDRVRVTAPDLTCTNPGFTNVAPYKTHLQTVVSARFCVAAALLGRPVDSYDFYDAHREDAEVLDLATRVDLAVGPGTDSDRIVLEVEQRGKKITTAGFQMETLTPTTAKIVAKFRRLTSDFLGNRTEKVIETVTKLERLQDIRQLTELLRAPA